MLRPIIIRARNVNDALTQGVALMCTHAARKINCRPNAAGSTVMEHSGLVVTHYERPCERVLFNPIRNANPFFHFMEALWILAGRNDVGWIAHFNKRMREFSDTGSTFHGAYGYRLRGSFDQFRYVLRELSDNRDSRRATMAIFEAEKDQVPKSKDIPCNCTLSFMIREEELHMTVYNRSNDMVWGAYGANVVQFSTIQELLARALGVHVGTYSQVSNSFHVYETEPTWNALIDSQNKTVDHYVYPFEGRQIQPFNMMIGIDPTKTPGAKMSVFDTGLTDFMRLTDIAIKDGSLITTDSLPYFDTVATPLFNAWQLYKSGAVWGALGHATQCKALDWSVAAELWLKRSRLAQDKPL